MKGIETSDGYKQENFTYNSYNFISVLITAYKRREFIIEAVKSVLNQTLNPTFFEVIVSKSFLDKDIDYFLTKNDIMSLYIDDDRYGYRLSEALKKSKGNIVVTLDDDDKFLPFFLERVYTVFSLNRYICAYQKRFVYFDSSGLFYYKQYLPKFNKKKHNKPSTYDLGSREGFNIAVLLNASYGQLVIKKDILIPYLDDLPKVKTSLDTMLFVVATLERCKIFIDNQELTLIRAHKDSETMLNNKDLDNNFFQRKVNSINKLLSDYELFINLSKKYNNFTLKRIIDEFKNTILIERTLISNYNNFKELLSIAIERLRITILKISRDPINAIGGYLMYNFFLLLHLINKEKARRIYFGNWFSRLEKSKTQYK